MRWVHTSDIHGTEITHSLRRLLGADVLSDGGDNLQGTAWTAFANGRLQQGGVHLVAQEMNEMEYDIAVVGNHEIEAGVELMGRWMSDCRFPVLGVNVRTNDAEVAKRLLPYVVVERGGMRIAVIGLVTEAVKRWVDEQQRGGVIVKNVMEIARIWVETVRHTEAPDAIVGMFHSGWEGGIEGENVVKMVAEQVEGFDVILYGHDHHAAIHKVKNSKGHEVLCAAPGGMGSAVVVMDVCKNEGTVKFEAKVVSKNEIDTLAANDDCAKKEMTREERYPEYVEWLSSPVCQISAPLDERDSFFGPSAFVALFHDMQKWATGADVSFASPVNYDSFLHAGALTMKDLFTLYRFNTKLYVMKLTGREIRNVLEMSYALWTNEMRTEEDDALLLDYIFDDGKRKGLKNFSLNMLSASGIDYEVDLRKKNGEKVRVLSMSDGSPFCDEREYRVAVNSYHGSGGGNLFTQGAGISLDDLRCRVENVLPNDYRQCLIDYLQAMGMYIPAEEHNWRFVPEAFVKQALNRDRITLFGEESHKELQALR